MRVIVKTMPKRLEFVSYLKKCLPNLEVCMDEKKDAMDTFVRAMYMAGDDPAIHIEDDIILTQNFYKKALSVIRDKPFSIIQFFSMRKADLTVGSRWDNTFMMNQCHYHPPFYSKMIGDYSKVWHRITEHPYGYDTMMQDWLKGRKEKYWIHVPSLVEHRVAKSQIDPRRSSKRQSLTFTDPWVT